MGVTVEQEVCLLHTAVGGQPLQQEVADALGLLWALPGQETRPSVPTYQITPGAPCCGGIGCKHDALDRAHLPKRVLEQQAVHLVDGGPTAGVSRHLCTPSESYQNGFLMMLLKCIKAYREVATSAP